MQQILAEEEDWHLQDCIIQSNWQDSMKRLARPVLRWQNPQGWLPDTEEKGMRASVCQGD